MEFGVHWCSSVYVLLGGSLDVSNSVFEGNSNRTLLLDIGTSATVSDSTFQVKSRQLRWLEGIGHGRLKGGVDPSAGPIVRKSSPLRVLPLMLPRAFPIAGPIKSNAAGTPGRLYGSCS